MTRLVWLTLVSLLVLAQFHPAAAAEILLQSALNGRFVTLGANGYLAATAERRGDALVVDLVALPENRVALRLPRSNSFIRVAPGGEGLMTDGGAEIGRRERFDILHLRDGMIALKSLASGGFVRVEAAPAARMAAAGPGVGPAERFVIVRR